MATLTVEITASTGTTARRELDRDSISIGRAPDNALVLDEEHVATIHARIFRGRGGFLVEDLGGRGTWLVREGERVAVADPLELESGDELEIGAPGAEQTRLRVSFAGEPSSTQ